MHCSSCIWLLEHLYKLDPGIHQAQVNFPKKEISIAFDLLPIIAAMLMPFSTITIVSFTTGATTLFAKRLFRKPE